MVSFSLGEPEIKDRFIWLDYSHPYLEELRIRFKLENLINEYMSDLEKVEVVMGWVNSLWVHDGGNIPKRFDPLFILDEVSNGKHFRCVEYSIVLNGCLNALGYTSRILSLKTEDCETREYGAGHVVVEVYIPEMKKWIMADPQFNVVPYRDSQPLNAAEFSAASKSSICVKNSFENDFSYFDWISPYLFYLTINFDNRINDGRSYKEKEQLMLVPLNANYPKVFQRLEPIVNVLYTNSLKRFYVSPQ